MRIRLIDHTTETQETSWGTCDLCEHTGEFDYTTLRFQADDGSEPYDVEAFDYMSWYGVVGIEIENLYDFAYWLGRYRTFEPGEVIDTEYLKQLVDEWDQWRARDHGFAL